MFVSSYQIHNVLNVYSKHLSQGRIAKRQKVTNKKPLADQISFSLEGKRKATIEKVAKDILNKITHYGSKTEVDKNVSRHLRGHLEKWNGSQNRHETQFVFNEIDELNKKTTNKLAIENTNFLINRLEQLARDAGGNSMDVQNQMIKGQEDSP
jgi:hypothetical protein